MNHRTYTDEEYAVYKKILRKRMLIYGFSMSLLGFPLGILLDLPVVWGFAFLGIVIGGIKLYLCQNSA